jgi:nickel-dependent lactate racemase
LVLPDGIQYDWIEPAYIFPADDPTGIVEEALRHPVDGKTLQAYAGAHSVAIAVNDKTRPVPHEHLLPPLLAELLGAGISAEAITLIVATGTHAPMPTDEFQRILPSDICKAYHVISHDCDDPSNLVSLGATSRGTVVWANRNFMDADLRIVVGNIEPHHFAGFSGGYKTAAIGLAGRQTINQNHAMLIDPQARIASFEHNPLRQDIEEIGDLFGVHFALNAILNGDKKIVRAVSGSPRAVAKAGIPLSQDICQVKVSGGKYDLVLASVGGAPKDINLYQSQKALTHASLFTRDGGTIILVAECPEGSGSRLYEEFMEGVETPQAVFEKFRTLGFRVGPHKAFQIARDAARVQIILVSEMPAEKVSRLLITPAATLSAALDLAAARLSPRGLLQDLRIAVLPRATNTIPVS